MVCEARLYETICELLGVPFTNMVSRAYPGTINPLGGREVNEVELKLWLESIRTLMTCSLTKLCNCTTGMLEAELLAPPPDASEIPVKFVPERLNAEVELADETALSCG